MNSPRTFSRHSVRRGNSLLLVFIIVSALMITVAAVMKTLVFDKKLNRRIALAAEARNAAEGAAEIAIAELDRRANSYSSLTSDPLSGFTMPTDAKSFLAYGEVQASSIAFKAGQLSDLPSKPVELLSTDPFYKPEPSDSGAGKPVILRHGYIYGRATTKDQTNGTLVNSYISTLVQVREQTWLSYAIFYNLDLEFHAGSAMDVRGPIHSNANIYARSETGYRLNAFGPVTTPKKLLRKIKYDPNRTSHQGDVYFPFKPKATATSDLTAMALTGEDSSRSDFMSFASTKWKGFVQDKSFGVKPFNPPGLLQYVEDDYSTSGVDETRNPAYAMIEPQLAKVNYDDAANHTFAGWKGDETENQKFSALSGFLIRVTAKLDTATGNLVNQDGTALSSTKPGWSLIYYDCADNGRPVNRSNLPNRDATSGKPTEFVVDLAKMHTDLLTILNKAVQLVAYKAANGNTSLTAPTLPSGETKYALADSRQGFKLGSTSNDGFKGAHHTLQVNMRQLNCFLRYGLDLTASPIARDLTKWKNTSGDTTQMVYPVDTAWSGIVYVEMPLIPYSDITISARDATDKIRPAVRATTTTPGFATVVVDAKKLPSLPTDTAKRDDGFTLATNGPLYLRGNFNAGDSDGTAAADPNTAPDTYTATYDPDSTGGTGGPIWPYVYTELPALLAGDAVSILSEGYADNDMRDSPIKHGSGSLRTASNTVVSAAILSGIVPTRLTTSGVGSNDQWAGGVHNFVRFLENWSGKTFRLRGAIVCLWENEVSKGPWYQGEYAYWYGVPTRNVGYHNFFAGGRFPPGLPVLRTVRRMAVSDITEAQYNAGPPKPPKAGD